MTAIELRSVDAAVLATEPGALATEPDAVATDPGALATDARVGAADPGAVATQGVAPRPALRLILLRFLVVGATSFGGGIVAYLRVLLVERTRWLTADEFMAALEIGQTLPGLNATNISVITGGRLRGWRGALVALLALIAPGALVIYGLGLLAGGDSRLEAAALAGVAAGSVGLLMGVMVTLGADQFRSAQDVALIGLTFLLLGVLKLPLPVVLVACVPLGIVLHRPRSDHATPERSRSVPGHPLRARLAHLLHAGADRA